MGIADEVAEQEGDVCMLERLVGDVRFALRTFARTPSFTAAVLITVALAVGATTSIFAVVHGVLLRPLPFADSERAVMLCETNPTLGSRCVASPVNVAGLERSSVALESAGVAREEVFIARAGEESYSVAGAIATPGFFQALHLRAALGRVIEERDLPRGANQVAVVSHAFWQRRLGGDPAAVGRSIRLDDKAFTVVGILPEGAYLPGKTFPDVEVWKPLTASVDDVEDRSWRGFMAIGRRAASASPAALALELEAVRLRLAEAYPEANKAWGLRVVPLREALVGDVRPTLLVFLGAVAFVLLIACANVASLLLVRATGRRAEFAVRASLGAGRRRLVQQLITESLVLSVAGGALGLLLAAWATAAFVKIAPASIPRLAEVSIDGRVVLFAFALAVLTSIVFGFAPARSAWRTDLNATLKGMRAGGGEQGRLRATFVVAQLALALVLLFGGGLLARGFGRLIDWTPGFQREGVVTSFMIPPPSAGPAMQVMQRVRDAVAGVPGVQAAALGSAGPLFGGSETAGLQIDGRRPFPANEMPPVQWFNVDPHYFGTLGMHIVRGRGLSAADVKGAVPVGVINETLARRFFPGQNPIGQRVTVNEHSSEIVGVVADLQPLPPDAPGPQIYWPNEQYLRLAACLIVRSTPGVTGIEKAVRARAAAVHPGIQLSPFVSLDERFARTLVRPRFNMLLVASFALVAVLLAAIGVYGVIAYGVASRTRELGIRVALGARPRHLVLGVVRQGMLLAAVGVGGGVLGALAIGRVLTSLLNGLPARDPLTLVSSALVLLGVALVSCWLPARRASRLDPVSALRGE